MTQRRKQLSSETPPSSVLKARSRPLGKRRKYLTREGLDAASPRSAIRNSFQAGALSEEDAQALEMLGDRNRSVHTYNEGLALTIFARLETYAKLLARWLDALEESAS